MTTRQPAPTHSAPMTPRRPGEFTVHLDQDGDPQRASCPTLPAAHRATEHITALTTEQLHRNGEGHSQFWLHLLIRDPAGQIAGYVATPANREPHPTT